jgi:hypothetical protein
MASAWLVVLTLLVLAALTGVLSCCRRLGGARLGPCLKRPALRSSLGCEAQELSVLRQDTFRRALAHPRPENRVRRPRMLKCTGEVPLPALTERRA